MRPESESRTIPIAVSFNYQIMFISSFGIDLLHLKLLHDSNFHSEENNIHCHYFFIEEDKYHLSLSLEYEWRLRCCLPPHFLAQLQSACLHDAADERKIKNKKGHGDYCPLCHATKTELQS